MQVPRPWRVRFSIIPLFLSLNEPKFARCYFRGGRIGRTDALPVPLRHRPDPVAASNRGPGDVSKGLPLFEIALAPVRLNHVASGIVNADDGMMRSAVELLGVPQPTEWQRI